MSAEHEIAAPALLARIDTVSPWQPTLRTSHLRRWPALLSAAWREGLEFYVRAAMARGRWGGAW